jgi:hypothetical protein
MKLLSSVFPFSCASCLHAVEITRMDVHFVRCRCIFRRCERYGIELLAERPAIEATIVQPLDVDGVESEGGEIEP